MDDEIQQRIDSIRFANSEQGSENSLVWAQQSDGMNFFSRNIENIIFFELVGALLILALWKRRLAVKVLFSMITVVILLACLKWALDYLAS
ncbi:MAG: hypothetical protein R3B52_03270 [Candidatus Paceibacterota bacterium]